MSDWCPENDGAYRAELAHKAKVMRDRDALSTAMELPEVKAMKDALYECQTALTDFGKAYPHMVKGYMLDAENNAIVAIAAIKEPKT